IGPVLLVLATWLVMQAASGVRWAPALLIALTAADLAAYGLTYAVWPNTVELQAYIHQQNLPPQTPGTRVAVNTGFEDPLLRFGNRPGLAGYSLADGYAGLEPAPPADVSSERRWQLAGTAWKRTAGGWEPLSNLQ